MTPPEAMQDRSSVHTAPIEQLLQRIPPAPIVSLLAHTFFTEVNWRFGIPEPWFHSTCSQTWNAIRYSSSPGAQVNANWLCLLFTVLACSPRDNLDLADTSLDSPESYFYCAMTARRIAENDFLSTPSVQSATDGSVLACLAVPLLCEYLAERGHVSEVGHSNSKSISEK